MKKLYMVMLALLCLLLGACGGDGNPTGTEGEKSLYDYSYKENKDGSVTLTVKGEWKETEKWSHTEYENTMIVIKEVKQTKNQAEFTIAPGEIPLPYHMVFFILEDTTTEKNIYNIQMTIAYESEESKFKVESTTHFSNEDSLNVEYEETEDPEDLVELSSEEKEQLEKEEQEYENQQQEQEEQEKLDEKNAKEFVWSHISAVKFPEEIKVLSAGELNRTIGDETLTCIIFHFKYKGGNYSCMVSETEPLSKFQTIYAIDSGKAIEKEMNGITTYHFPDEKSARYFMWKDHGDIRYVIMDDENPDNILEELAALFLE